MKKLMIALCILMLALTAFSCALAAEGDANIAMNIEDDYNDSVSGGCVVGDTLYLQGYRNLYTWKQGEADVTAYPYDMDRYSVDDMDYSSVQNVISDGEKIYALVAVQSSEPDEDGSYNQRLQIAEMSIKDDKACFGEAVEADISDLMVSYTSDGQSYSYMASVSNAAMVGDTIYLVIWDNDGDAKMYAMPKDGSRGSFADIEYPYLVTPYKDGQLLVETQDYNGGESGLYIYNPEDESVTTVKVFDSYDDMLYGIVYSTESDRLFYMADGYVMAVEDFDFENATQAAQLSTAYYTNLPSLLMPGDYYVSSTYYATCVRNTDPTALPTSTINVVSSYSNALISAYYSYGNSHPETGVILSTDGVSDDELIQAMMNHDSSVDIYEINVSSLAYDSLFNRGYMAELDGSSTLTEAVDGMYPAIQEALKKDGKLYAIPTMTNSQTMGYYAKAFEKVGITAEEMPDNWPDFLAMLKDLETQLPSDGSVTLFDSEIAVTDAKTMMLGAIWDSYAYYLNIHGEDTGYNTEELRSLMDAALNLDYEALGCLPDPEETEDGTSYYGASFVIGGSSDSSTLLDSYSGCTIGDMTSDLQPLLLSIVKGEEAPLPVQLMVVFVNPYTEHMEEALAYMEEVYARLPETVLYNLSDALNEPQRYSGYEKSVEESEKQIAEVETRIESADPVDKPVLEQYKQDLESSLESYKEYAWAISRTEIDWYRAHADRLQILHYNYAYQNYSVYSLMSDLQSGATTLDDFLQEIDRTSRMQAMEGN